MATLRPRTAAPVRPMHADTDSKDKATAALDNVLSGESESAREPYSSSSGSNHSRATSLASSSAAATGPGAMGSLTARSALSTARTHASVTDTLPPESSSQYFQRPASAKPSARGGEQDAPRPPTTLAEALAQPIASLEPEQKESSPLPVQTTAEHSVTMTTSALKQPTASSSSASKPRRQQLPQQSLQQHEGEDGGTTVHTTPSKRAATATRIRPGNALSSSPQASPSPSPSSSPSPSVASAWSFAFPEAAPSPARAAGVRGSAGVFKTYFSPAGSPAQPAYEVYARAQAYASPESMQAAAAAALSPARPGSSGGHGVGGGFVDSQASVPLVASPLAEFAPLQASPSSRLKHMEKQARRASAAKVAAAAAATKNGQSVSPTPSSLSPWTRPTTAASHRTLGHSASAFSLSGAAESVGLGSTAAAAATAASSCSGGNSFARRMIHAQSAAELATAAAVAAQVAEAQPLSDDPDAASLFFDPRSPPPQQQRYPGEEDETGPYSSGIASAHSQTRTPQQQQALVPFNPTNSYASYASTQPQQQQFQQRPSTAGGVPSQSWSSKLTAVLTAESAAASPARKLARPMTSSSSGRRMASSSSAASLSLPPELQVGVTDMPAHMQREHAALAKLIANLEPAGRGSLAGASAAFSKLGTKAGRDALFSGKKGYQEPSVVHRPPVSSEADELLRRRSVQKGYENAKQSSAALASRGASGLAANNLNGRAVADAVRHTNAEFPISDERPRSTRPPSAAPQLGVAAALAAAGSAAASELITAVTGSGVSSSVSGSPASTPAKKLLLRPSTSTGTRPGTAAGGGGARSQRSVPSSPATGPLILLPGMSSASSSSSSSGPTVSPAGVLGFGGSIDRFGLGVDALRFAGSATSATGGRGMLGSKSATRLLGQHIPTSGAEVSVQAAIEASAHAAAAAGGGGGSAKKFASLALELDVSLQERLVRIDPRKLKAGSAAAALERLDAHRTVLDEIILHSPVFGSLLARVKAEYESYARRGGGGEGGNSDRNGGPVRASKTNKSGGVSAATLTQQQVEDTLVLENHRLHAKCHGFQRAYTSLYAKYKSVLHTQRVHEGLLAQNSLVLADLNAQLQAAVLASMSDEERQMERMRAEGFLLANETAEEAAENAAYRAAQEAVATLPDMHDEDDEEELNDPELRALLPPPGEDPASEAGRRRTHMRKVVKARRAAEKASKAASDPLERGRQLMRQFQQRLPAPAGSVAEARAHEAASEAVENELAAEGAPLSPSKLSSALDAGAPASAPKEEEDMEVVRARLRAQSAANPSDPASMVAAELAADPLEQLATRGKREVQSLRSEKAQLEDRLLRMQTQLEQSRAAELQARMQIEEIRKHRYEQDKAAATGAMPSRQQQTVASSSTSATPAPTPAHHAASHAMLDNIDPQAAPSASRSVAGSPAGSPVAIPPLPLGPLVAELAQLAPATQTYEATAAADAGGDDDDDPDTQLLDDIDSSKEATLAALKFQRDMVDSRMALQQAQEDTVAAAAAAAAAAEAAAVAAASSTGSKTGSVHASPNMSPQSQSRALLEAEDETDGSLKRKTSRSAYTLTGTIEEDNFFD